MKNILEILQENGIELNDEQSKAIEKSTLENYKTVKDYENQTEKLNLAEQKNSDTQKAFDEFKKGFDGVDVEGMRTKITELTDTLSNKEKEYETEKAKSNLENTLKEKAVELGCVDYELAHGLLNVDDLLASKDLSADIEKAFSTLKESKPILFKEEETDPIDKLNIIGRTDGKLTEGDISMRKAMGLPVEGGKD
ncbi:phage scaffolding protein [Amedibacillus sp. YH-ame6]